MVSSSQVFLFRKMFNSTRMIKAEETQVNPDSLLRLATHESLKKEGTFHKDIPRNILPKLKMILGYGGTFDFGNYVTTFTPGYNGMLVKLNRKNKDYERMFLIPYKRTCLPKDLLDRILYIKQHTTAYSHCSISEERTVLTFSAISLKTVPPHCREMLKIIIKRKNGCNILNTFHKHWHTRN